MSSIKKETIIKLVKKGLPVFPVELKEIGGKVQKKPLVDWNIYRTRLPSIEEIEVWCAMFDFNGLGMPTGKISGIAVVDIDDPNNDYGFSSNVTTKTISGGKHCWYKYHAGIKNTTRVAGKPIDVRGEGGFIVIPPSGINDNQKYTWLNYDFNNLQPFPKLPTKAKPQQSLKELPHAYEGSRNDTAIRVAGSITGSMSQNHWETYGWLAFQSWNQNFSEPPLDDRELKITWESACQMNVKQEVLPSIYKGQEIQRVYQNKMEQWGDGLSTGFQELDYYFKFLPEHLYLISAPTHAGKTLLALNISGHIAQTKKVLFCSLEQGVFVAPRLMSIFGQIPSNFSLLESSELMTSKKLIETIDDLDERPDIIVIDHLHFMAKDTRNGTTAGIDKMIIELQNTAKKLSLPIIVISHLRKLNENKTPTLDDLRDSSSLAQVPSVILQMIRDEDETKTMKDTGTLYVRKNRITGTMGAIDFLQDKNGNFNFYQYKTKKMER